MLLTADIEKTFESGFRVRAAIEVPAGRSVTILFGPSGAGKTTLLRAIAGLENPTAGKITFGERCWFDSVRGVRLPPQQRPIGYVFQDYALFPHLKVRDNIGFGARHLAKSELAAHVERAAKALEVGDLLDRWPSELSGGQQQRVALARALARSPQLLLLDEPLSALDGGTRDRVRGELTQILKAMGIPAIVVTHDWVDALSWGDRMMVMSRGAVLETGIPVDVFSRPSHPEVAEAAGIENIAIARVRDRKSGMVVLTAGNAELVAADPGDGQAEYFACIRGENVVIERGQADRSSARNHLNGRVSAIVPTGALFRVTIDVGFHLVALITRPAMSEMELAEGVEVTGVFKASAVHLIPRNHTKA